MPNCCVGCLEGVGGSKPPKWRSAFCGCMPIALAVIVVDLWVIAQMIAVVNTPVPFDIDPKIMPRHPAGAENFVWILGNFCSLLAAIGPFSQRVNARLARVSYYLLAVSFIVALVISVIAFPILFVALSVTASFKGGLIAFLISVLITLLLSINYWSLQLHRSLFYILSAGGSGWEYQTAEEIAYDKKAESVEEGQSAPLMTTPPPSYI